MRIREGATNIAGYEKAQLNPGHRNEGTAVWCCLLIVIKTNSQYTLWMERLQLCTNCIVQKRISYILENLSTVFHICGSRASCFIVVK